jgi:hypothetical protein
MNLRFSWLLSQIVMPAVAFSRQESAEMGRWWQMVAQCAARRLLQPPA